MKYILLLIFILMFALSNFAQETTLFDQFPTSGLAKAKTHSIKKLLAIRKIPAEKSVFIEAGVQENFTIEFWLVPAGAVPPKPTPTLAKMKYRKGKSYGFCLGCRDI